MNVRSDIYMVLVTVGLIFCIVAAWFGHWENNQTGFGVISMVAGVLAKCFSDGFSYEFGSSRSSEDKTALLSQSVPASLLKDQLDKPYSSVQPHAFAIVINSSILGKLPLDSW